MGLSLHASWVVLAIGFATPFVVAFGVKQHNRLLQTAVSFVVVVATAVAAKLTNVVGDISVGELISIVGSAGLAAGASTKWLTGDAVGRVSRVTKKIGIGVNKSPTATPAPAPAGTVLPTVAPLQPVDPAQVTAAVSKPPPT